MCRTFINFSVFSTWLFCLSQGALLPYVALSSIHSLQPRTIPGYAYTGCYTEATNRRALSDSSFFDDNLTIENCALACSAFDMFGVEYGRECYCGNKLNDGSLPASEQDCSFSCPGNSAQTCGAGNRLNIYTKLPSTTLDSPTPPAIYTSMGCFSEPVNASKGRALSDKVITTSDMTVETCATLCAGFLFFGLEYYGECYCGNVLRSGSIELDTTHCQFPCSGNSAQTCGGDWAFNLYAFGDSTSTSVSPSAVALSASSSIIIPGSMYAADGCYTEATGQRALTGSVFYDDLMTIAKCEIICSGYTIYGIEYGRECYCGNALTAGSVSTAIEECSFECPGDSRQKCGAGNRLNIYRKASTPTPINILSSSTLPVSSTASSIDIAVASTPSLSNIVSASGFPVLSSESSVVLTSALTSTSSSASSTTSVASTTLTTVSSSSFLVIPSVLSSSSTLSTSSTTTTTILSTSVTTSASSSTLSSSSLSTSSPTASSIISTSVTVPTSSLTLSLSTLSTSSSTTSIVVASPAVAAPLSISLVTTPVSPSSSATTSSSGSSTSVSSTSSVKSSSTSLTTLVVSTSLSTSSSASSSITTSVPSSRSSSSSQAATTAVMTSPSTAASFTSVSVTSFTTSFRPSTTTTTSRSTTAACTATSTLNAVPDNCWAAMPTACSSMTRSLWPGNMAVATSCRDAFTAGSTVVPSVAKCFSNVNLPTFKGADAYSCVQGANVFCQSVSGTCDANGNPNKPAQTESVTDGGFESGGLSSWPVYSSSFVSDLGVSVSSDRTHKDRFAIKVSNGFIGGSVTFVQSLKLIPGIQYQASWWYYSTNSGSSSGSSMQLVGAAGFTKDVPTYNGLTYQWVQATQTFTSATSFAQLYFTVYGNFFSSSNIFYIDDISVHPLV